MAIAYTTRTGLRQFKPSVNALMRKVEADEYEGFCLACGHWQDGCEPDMRRGDCHDCGKPKVYGAAELLLMGLHS